LTDYCEIICKLQ